MRSIQNLLKSSLEVASVLHLQTCTSTNSFGHLTNSSQSANEWDAERPPFEDRLRMTSEQLRQVEVEMRMRFEDEKLFRVDTADEEITSKRIKSSLSLRVWAEADVWKGESPLLSLEAELALNSLREDDCIFGADHLLDENYQLPIRQEPPENVDDCMDCEASDSLPARLHLQASPNQMTRWNETELPEASRRKTRLFGMNGMVVHCLHLQPGRPISDRGYPLSPPQVNRRRSNHQNGGAMLSPQPSLNLW